MLEIHKDFHNVKAIVAGAVAFAIGLTGVAAYTSSMLEHENLTFNKVQSSTEKQDQKTEEKQPVDVSSDPTTSVNKSPASHSMPAYVAPSSSAQSALPVPTALTSPPMSITSTNSGINPSPSETAGTTSRNATDASIIDIPIVEIDNTVIQ